MGYTAGQKPIGLAQVGDGAVLKWDSNPVTKLVNYPSAFYAITE
jgi:hypothetical protein